MRVQRYSRGVCLRVFAAYEVNTLLTGPAEGESETEESTFSKHAQKCAWELTLLTITLRYKSLQRAGARARKGGRPPSQRYHCVLRVTFIGNIVTNTEHGTILLTHTI